MFILVQIPLPLPPIFGQDQPSESYPTLPTSGESKPKIKSPKPSNSNDAKSSKTMECLVCKKHYKDILRHLGNKETCKERYPLSPLRKLLKKNAIKSEKSLQGNF